MRDLDTLRFVPRKPRKSSLLFRVRFSDGREFWPPREGRLALGQVDLEAANGGGDPLGWEQQFRLPALPRKGGSVGFVCTWESRGIVDAQTELRSSAVLRAANHAAPLFRD